MKYSPKFDRMIDQIDSSSTTPEQRFALIDFQLRLEIDAPGEACYRCANGEFFLQYFFRDFRDSNNIKGAGTWAFAAVLGHCHAFMALARNADDQPGFLFPDAAFCTSFKVEDQAKS